MTRRKLMLVAIACLIAISASLASVTGPAAAQVATASFCSKAGPIQAADLASGVTLSTCPIQGRLVIRSDGGSSQMGARVPAPGHVEVGVATTRTGDYILAVTNEAGRVTTATSLPREKSQRMPFAVDPAVTDPACNELGVAYLGFVWDKTLKWYYNQSTVSRAGLNGPTTLTDIRGANTNMTTGVNNCGYPVNNFGSYIGGVPLGAYQGTTSKYANWAAPRFPDR